ncbi:DISARM system phospholipase D-like protein DrmC [Mycobacterium sp. 1245111.1]|uniref:DISARM system phospholipase D-like protein DrmC n=1 Tax=Mycobacterium sp. 1245111.1 TaxID=1834073 RepID=UPI000A58EAD9|nr:DISARM system phospholipase D-like protein DrmC [Mycobacterium sp. 1245111.1]
MSTAEIERLGELLSAEEAKSIAAALRQVKLPHIAAKRAYPAHRSEVQRLLKQLINRDTDAARVAAVLDGIAAVPQVHRPVVVWTSPSIPGSTGHTTLAALDMINDATTQIHAATYSAGKDSPHLAALRNALDRGVPVTVVVDVKERADAAALIAQRLDGARIWTLAEPANGQWAIQHSKLIAVDDRCSFVTSANFSTAAAMRSLECGMLSQDALIATGIREHLENLHTHGILIDFKT